MDTSSIVLGLVFLIVFTAPVAYAVMGKSKRKKQALKNIQEKAAIHQIQLNEIDVFGDDYIGIDHKSEQLIYGNLESLEKKMHIINFKNFSIDLLEIRKNDKSIKQISLVFKSSNTQHQFDFYKDNDDVKVSAIEQFELAKKWKAKLS